MCLPAQVVDPIFHVMITRTTLERAGHHRLDKEDDILPIQDPNRDDIIHIKVDIHKAGQRYARTQSRPCSNCRSATTHPRTYLPQWFDMSYISSIVSKNMR